MAHLDYTVSHQMRNSGPEPLNINPDPASIVTSAPSPRPAHAAPCDATPTSLAFHHSVTLQELHPLLEVDGLKVQTGPSAATPSPYLDQPATPMPWSDVERGPCWSPSPYQYDIMPSPSPYSRASAAAPYGSDAPAESFASYHHYDGNDGADAWPSNLGFGYYRPAPVPGDDVPNDDKPYAQLIFQALKHAPGHKMMLREIYEWFRLNTVKAQDPTSTGWQNSIRHNLSMNKAFENDRESSRIDPKRVNSVWILTDDAIKHGVQSTTRYRKSGPPKLATGGRPLAIQRQRSGAKGGRAARRAARQRLNDHFLAVHSTSSDTPTTPSNSEVSDYRSWDSHDLQHSFRAWTMSPNKEYLPVVTDTMGPPLPTISVRTSVDIRSSSISYADDTWQLQALFLRSN